MTEMVSLRPLRVADAQEMATVLAGTELYYFMGGEPPTAEELERLYTVQVRGRSSDGKETWLNHVVVAGAEQHAVGYVQATIPVDGSPTEVAWVVGVPWQGRGYATQAVLRLGRELQARGVVTIMAHIHSEHEASQRVARFLGMEPTGTMVDGEIRWTGALDRPFSDI
ncbi:RimJ/RimL family protein N-acetyltransferase [Kocuria rhizophila]|uniref:GNAT family N-acetyltransferase n=1 Tax=Kocuria TaxID=57493 RepID=UPI000DD2CD1B|nr:MULTISPECIES: GNAT family N-acetyltransferase [Kocuria]MCC5671416.1 GNAT family N-acetyltransferase [Kocuria rhizophila]MCC5673347.1 GNAT family N-acetyltransferase [Kocuria rhizophila]HBH56413.1 N-acetyltransferase [Kocuria sp.]